MLEEGPVSGTGPRRKESAGLPGAVLGRAIPTPSSPLRILETGGGNGESVARSPSNDQNAIFLRENLPLLTPTNI